MIEIEKLYKIYKGYVETVVLENFTTSIENGEIVTLAGPSGSGKSTLIQILGGILKPSSGRVIVDGTDISKLPEEQLTDYRKETVGLIYQDFNLIDQFTVYENIALPMLIADKDKNHIDKQVGRLLDNLGISRYKNTYPRYMSGGEKQRVAIAVALANDPPIILADEPTGNLDRKNSNMVMKLLIDQTKELDKTLLIATHDQKIIQDSERTINLVELSE